MSAEHDKPGSHESTDTGQPSQQGQQGQPGGMAGKANPFQSKRTQERAVEVVGHVAAGVPINLAAERCGIARSTLYRWRAADEAFDRAILAARAAFLTRQLERIDKAAEDDWKAASWLLERSEPSSFGRRVEVTVEAEGRAVVDPLTGQVIEPGSDPTSLLPPRASGARGDRTPEPDHES